MIADIDKTLWRMLTEELAKMPDCPIREPDQVTFDPPDVAEAADASKIRVNLYLHDVRENAALRDGSFHFTRKPGEDTVGVKRGPVRLDLSYLITCYAGRDSSVEHRLLADVLAVLLRHRAVPTQYFFGTLEGHGADALPLVVAQSDHPSYTDPPALWQAMGGRLRPALGMTVIASFDPFETKWTKVVREAIIGLGLGTPPDGPQRPLNMSAIRVSAAGVVTDSSQDKPLPGVTITISERDEKALTDERGFFSILNLPPRRYTLRFRKTGYHEQELETVAPPPGRPDQLEPFVVALRTLSDAERAQEIAQITSKERNAPGLVEAGRTYRVSLSGLLRLPDGRPAAYIPVRVGQQHTTTDADGVYCFFDLPTGSHTVIADVPGHGEMEVPPPGEIASAPATESGKGRVKAAK